MNTYKAPAKLNLGLKVVGKRPDGYHLLKTVFCLIDLYDEITILINNKSSNIQLLNHTQDWAAESDLVIKASKLLQQHTKCNLGASIEVKKRIPHGGGMGGGSSDAATTLMALNQLWNTNLSKNELMDLGIQLGADVPFFILEENAYAEGIGEILTPIKIPQKYFVLILPEFNISTKEVFSKVNLTYDNTIINITPQTLLNTLENDIEIAARGLEPRLESIFQDLAKYHANARMTGSGSTIYLCYDDYNTAKKVAEELKFKYNAFLIKSLLS